MATKDDSLGPVTVLETSDQGLIAVAKSLLEEADIPFFAKGEGIQDLIGGGRIGAFNILAGPIQLQVSADDADEARELLKTLDPDS
jgi:putative signal transducing protein